MALPRYITEASVRMQPEQQIKLEKKEQLSSYPFHNHTFTELVLVAEGCAVHRHIDLAGKERVGTFLPGDLIAIGLGEKHAYERCHRLILYNIWVFTRICG